MKVLVISAAFPPMRAGEADYAFHFSQRLAARGLSVHVLTARSVVPPRDRDITVYPIMRNWSWLDLPRLVRCVGRCAPDVILLMYVGWIYDFHPMITFAPTILKSALSPVRFVSQISGPEGANPSLHPLATRALRKGIARWAGGSGVDYAYGTLLRDSDKIIVLGDRHRSILSKLYSSTEGKTTVVPPPPIMRISAVNNGVSRERGRKALGVESCDFVIVFFGYMYPGKGVETLLEAFQRVLKKHSHVRLIFVGGDIAKEFPNRPGYAQEMHQLSRRLGINDRVTWVGGYSWDSDEGSLFLRAADVCVLPFDGGISVNSSSLAAVTTHDLPVIATRPHRYALEPAFIDQENVLLCPAKDPEGMAGAIEKVMDNRDLRQRLSAGARGLARNHFSWDKAIDDTIETLRGAIS